MFEGCDNYGIDRKISRFVCPISSALKADGPAVFVSSACMFVAQTQPGGVSLVTVVIIWYVIKLRWIVWSIFKGTWSSWNMESNAFLIKIRSHKYKIRDNKKQFSRLCQSCSVSEHNLGNLVQSKLHYNARVFFNKDTLKSVNLVL